jgi:hypothetical protein
LKGVQIKKMRKEYGRMEEAEKGMDEIRRNGRMRV